jgi:TonB family protein
MCGLLGALLCHPCNAATTAPATVTSGKESDQPKSILDEWDQKESALRQSVWRAYSATAALGKDSRGRTLEDDLKAWVMSDETRGQLREAREKAEHELQAGNVAGARASWEAAKATLDEQSRRLAWVGFYWSERMTLERIRALWLYWLNQVPEEFASTSRHRIDELDNQVAPDFATLVGAEALTKRITALKVAYDEERRKLAAQVSARRLASGEMMASRDRTVSCPVTEVAPGAGSRGKPPGDHGPQLLDSLSASDYYPTDARHNLVTGDVILRVTVGVDSCVRRIEVQSSSGSPDLDDMAMELAERAKFRPAEKQGQMVEDFLKVKYHFELNDKGTATNVPWTPPPTRAPSHVALGNQLLERREYDRAIEEFDQAIAEDPQNARAWADRGLCYMWKRDSERATQDLDTAFKLDPQNTIVAHGRGMLALHANDLTTAVTQFSFALERSPKDAFARLWRAQAYIRLGDLDHALDDYATVIQQTPDRTDAYIERAVILRALNATDEALREADAVTAANPNNAAAYRAAGHIYAASKRSEQAMRSFDRAIEIESSATSYLARAENRSRTDLAGRKADAEAALQQDPHFIPAILFLARMQSAEGNGAGALATVNDALMTQPDDDRLITFRSVLYLRNKQPTLARQDFATIRGRATDATALNSLCWALATAALELETALSACDAAITIAPDVAAYHDSRGFVLLQLGRYADAIAAYNEALKWRPFAPDSLYGRGQAKRRQGDHAGADADTNAALNLNARVVDQFADYSVR